MAGGHTPGAKAHVPRTVPAAEAEASAYLEAEALAYLEAEALAYLEAEALAYLEAEALAYLEAEALAYLEACGVPGFPPGSEMQAEGWLGEGFTCPIFGAVRLRRRWGTPWLGPVGVG